MLGVDFTTVFTLNSFTGTCTTNYANNGSTNRQATVSVQVQYEGKTATSSTIITQLPARYATLTINRSNYNGDWALFDNSNPSANFTISYILENGTGTFTYSPGEGITVNNASGNLTTVSVPGTVYVWDVDQYNMWTYVGSVYVNGASQSVNI